MKRQHAGVLELREQLRQVLNLPSFSTLPNESAARTEVADSLNSDIILRLIDLYLRETGFIRAADSLRKESNSFSGANPESTLISYRRHFVRHPIC